MFTNLDLATLAAFAATYPTIFEEFMAEASERITLLGETCVSETPSHVPNVH